MIRILLVDDQNLVQQGIKALLDQDSNFKVIGTVKDGRSAVEQTDLLNPDIVLIDIEMPDMDGITATKYITHLAPKTKVIILTSYEDKKYVMQALLAGAKGYILKSSLITDLKQAILAVNNGYSQVESRLLDKIFNPDNFKPRKTESLSNQKSQEIKSSSVQSKQSPRITENQTVIKLGKNFESEGKSNKLKLENNNSQVIANSAEVGNANNFSTIDRDRESSDELNRHQDKSQKKVNSIAILFDL
jgi:DNA-binding NarL/FixJ family response regulator